MPRHSRTLLAALIAIMAANLTGCAMSPPTQPSPAADSTGPTSAPPLIAATLADDIDAVRSHLASGTNPNLVYHTNTALTYAARDGFTDIAELLIDYGAEVNWVDGEGVTPLILAAFKGHTELVALLLNHGADVNVIDQWDRTALDYALRRGEDDAIVEMLRQPR
ncbi:MAG: ankyrin repeat domain-containing protein [Leptolyngbya sp. RL_3_1]|nr:ankyrin repeat domain-containing protein [Leptolyngbya sp. RL_3_1]